MQNPSTKVLLFFAFIFGVWNTQTKAQNNLPRQALYAIVCDTLGNPITLSSPIINIKNYPTIRIALSTDASNPIPDSNYRVSLLETPRGRNCKFLTDLNIEGDRVYLSKSNIREGDAIQLIIAEVMQKTSQGEEVSLVRVVNRYIVAYCTY